MYRQLVGDVCSVDGCAYVCCVCLCRGLVPANCLPARGVGSIPGRLEAGHPWVSALLEPAKFLGQADSGVGLPGPPCPMGQVLPFPLSGGLAFPFAGGQSHLRKGRLLLGLSSKVAVGPGPSSSNQGVGSLTSPLLVLPGPPLQPSHPRAPALFLRGLSLQAPRPLSGPSP